MKAFDIKHTQYAILIYKSIEEIESQELQK